MRPVDPIDTCDRFESERRALIELLSGLAAQEWTAATACSGWDVKAVAAHILRGDLGILSRLRDNEPGSSIQPGDSLLRALNERNAQWADATRWLSGRVLCELLVAVDAPLRAYFASLDPVAPGEVVSWAGAHPAPNWLGIAREYTERWHHQQHIRDAVGKPGLTDRWSAGPVIATFMHALPPAFRDKRPNHAALVEVVVTGEAGGRWFAHFDRDAWQLLVDGSEPPDASVTIDQDTFWRLCTRGISRDIARERATVRGAAYLAEPVFDTVAIIA